MSWTLEKVMINLNEAIMNLKDDYPNKDQAQQAYGALTSLINYPIPKVLMVIHGYMESGPKNKFGVCSIKKTPVWTELVLLQDQPTHNKPIHNTISHKSQEK